MENIKKIKQPKKKRRISFNIIRERIKVKIFCKNCGVRLGGWRNKPIEFEDGNYCPDCSFVKRDKILEGDK